MKKLLKIVIGIAALFGFYYANNSWLQVTRYTVLVKKIPDSMEGLKVVQISDLHNAKFGEHQQRLVSTVRQENPDIILLTGDLIDRYHYDLQNSLEAVEKFITIAPVYFVDGNHEISTNKVDEIHFALEKIGVHVLSNGSVDFTWNNSVISIVGISDPLSGNTTDDMLSKALHKVPKDRFTLLLAHRSEFAASYAKYGVDLVYTGHAHGGQIRVPGIGGVINHQGQLFPNYLDGVIKTGDTQQVISRGLGNSLFPLRVFNRPEVVVTTLTKK